MSCGQTVALGAYLLGSLDPSERSSFERHVHGCSHCRREMVRLAPLPGLLGQVQLADLELPFDDPVPDPDLWPLPPAPEPEPAPAPPKRRRLLLVGAAVLILLIIVSGLLVPRLIDNDRVDDDAAVTWQATDTGSGVAASADLVRKSWGTELWMTIENMPKGMRCKLIVHDRAGRTEIGGWWASDHSADERIPGSTSFPVDQIERLDLVVDMKVLVSVRP
ncbi:anti-sigma factor [Saccharothrix sp. ALI-22-I]|uniref:anti-sigma factor family protein n=1 Tax=Saccharothrix sp. ALI-22-I TaxID=1933778 RepID=UPI00097CA326|nr:zf-HC2 domain-containing protein [Saccharothrix sp. ALI-22-I]ONI83245.1 anti-sigma factor [Saccharothrix sp. ALI-22-I]